MSEQENEIKPAESTPTEAKPAEAKQAEAKPREGKPNQEGKAHSGGPRPEGQKREGRGGNREGGGGGGGRERGERGDRGDRGDREHRGDRGDFRGGRPGGGRPDGPPEIDIDKLIGDSLYLDNQAHAVVSRMRDMDSGTKSQLRRFYNAVRRACRAPESERQHQFVMLRARLAYTIARHSLRSLDTLEKLLLQVTRKNDLRGYERFRDLFEAIVAYNE